MKRKISKNKRFLAISAFLVGILSVFIYSQTSLFRNERPTTMFGGSVACGHFSRVNIFIYSFADLSSEEKYSFLRSENVKSNLLPKLDYAFRSNNIPHYSERPDLYKFYINDYKESKRAGLFKWSLFKDQETLSVFINIGIVDVSGSPAIDVSVGKFRNVGISYVPDMIQNNLKGHSVFFLGQSKEELIDKMVETIPLYFCEATVRD
ncbi:MAG: hypothetical protein PHX61_06865 [Alphaproteobacteria bacterium]|nr:hypothetical protein [Alphaproteobacteria bacterium]